MDSVETTIRSIPLIRNSLKKSYRSLAIDNIQDLIRVLPQLKDFKFPKEINLYIEFTVHRLVDVRLLVEDEKYSEALSEFDDVIIDLGVNVIGPWLEGKDDGRNIS